MVRSADLTNLSRSQNTPSGLVRPAEPNPRFPHELVLIPLRPLTQSDRNLGKVQDWI